MTTRSGTVRREAVADWPILAGRDLPPGTGVLTIELRRQPGEDIAPVVSEAAGLLRQALRAVSAHQARWWLLLLGRPSAPSGRVEQHLADRKGLWGTVPGVPDGPQEDTEIRYADGSAGLAGTVRFDEAQLGPAIEVTRVCNAVCVLAGESPLAAVVRSVPPLVRGVPPPLLPLVLSEVRHLGVARGFGAFDDASAGAEVFGRAEFLDEVARIQNPAAWRTGSAS